MAEEASTVAVVWTWTSIVQVAFTTGFFTAALNQLFALLKDAIQRRQKDRVDGRDFALQLVELLTAYAQECNSRSIANAYDDQLGDYARFSGMPNLKQYPEGPWGILPSRLAAGIRDLRNEVAQAARDIEATIEVDGPKEGADVASRRFGTVGYKSLLLANELRADYRLGRYQAAGRSGFEAHLRQQYRLSNPGPFKRLWGSLTVARMRQRFSRWRSRIKGKFRDARRG